MSNLRPWSLRKSHRGDALDLSKLTVMIPYPKFIRLLLQAVMIIGRQSTMFICKLLLEFPNFSAPKHNGITFDYMFK